MSVYFGGTVEKTTIDQAKIGSKLAKDVYTISGKLLVKKGSTYREPFIEHFREHGVHEIFIEPEGDVADVEATFDPVEMSRVVPDIKLVIEDKTRHHAYNQIKKTLSSISAVSNANIYKLKMVVEEIIEEMFKNKDFVLTLSQMRSVDDYTYQHSVNVGVLSILIGVDLGLDKDTLKQLGIGAILHDIGKIMISDDIIKKPAKLTTIEYQEVKKHTDYGYELLKRTNVSEEAAQIALFHHEKYDGSGYNKGLASTSIPLFARIVAVADVYDAMSNDRVYKKKVPHDQVFREISHLGNQHFDSKIMETFVRRLCIYPNGCGVILSSGERGMVIGQNGIFPESPQVRIFTPKSGNIKSLYYDIDLSKDRRHHIIGTF